MTQMEVPSISSLAHHYMVCPTQFVKPQVQHRPQLGKHAGNRLGMLGPLAQRLAARLSAVADGQACTRRARHVPPYNTSPQQRRPTHAQISNVVFENADIAIIMDSCSFNTIQNVTFTSVRPKSPLHSFYGGKGVWLKVRSRDMPDRAFDRALTKRPAMHQGRRRLP